VDLILSPIYSEEFCSNPGLAIPDNNSAGIWDKINVSLGSTVTDIAVYVDITHTYIGDLVVELVSPEETTVVLHNRTGGTTNNLVGWYPAELTPAEDLSTLLDQTTDGEWKIHVSDNGSGDTGTLNSWCVDITYDISTGVAEAGDKLPKVLALKGNVPNPFNPQTTIRFDLPTPGNVNLAIYEISGRRVATLVSGSLPAGYHESVWTGLDESGRSVASGIYFYRLEADNEVLTRKMILLR